MTIINLVYERKEKNFATQWPCPDLFHVPTHDEIVALYDAWISLWAWNSSWWNNLKNYLKLPFAWNRGTWWWTSIQWTQWMYQTSSAVWSPYSYILSFNSFAIYQNANWLRWNSYSIRAYKNISVKPDSTRTVLYQWTWNAGIYHSSTLWLISISSDGTNWITIADKNLWATAVYNNWDALSEANCGKYYQRWNNYWFPRTWSVTTSSTQVNAQNFWPWNYYSSSTFITQNAWDSSDNQNLRWWEDGNVPV